MFPFSRGARLTTTAGLDWARKMRDVAAQEAGHDIGLWMRTLARIRHR